MNIPIRHIRDAAVMLDADVKPIYGVPTKRLKEQVKRNKDRFPADFVFRLTSKAWREVRANSTEVVGQEYDKIERSQIATGSNRVRLRDQIARPYAFTERELGFHVRERAATYRVKRRRP